MIEPSGNAPLPSRKASTAWSLPRMARMSLRSPSSRATEINRQSRYPGGIVIPKIGAASSPAAFDVDATAATTPASATVATKAQAMRFRGTPSPKKRGVPEDRCNRNPKARKEKHDGFQARASAADTPGRGVGRADGEPRDVLEQ